MTRHVTWQECVQTDAEGWEHIAEFKERLLNSAFVSRHPVTRYRLTALSGEENPLDAVSEDVKRWASRYLKGVEWRIRDAAYFTPETHINRVEDYPDTESKLVVEFHDEEAFHRFCKRWL